MIAITYVPTNYVRDICGLLSPEPIEIDIDFNNESAVKAEVLKLFDGAKLILDIDYEQVYGLTYKDVEDCETAEVNNATIEYCGKYNDYYTIVVAYNLDNDVTHKQTEVLIVTDI